MVGVTVEASTRVGLYMGPWQRRGEKKFLNAPVEATQKQRRSRDAYLSAIMMIEVVHTERCCTNNAPLEVA